jgi:hypothetical protein
MTDTHGRPFGCPTLTSLEPRWAVWEIDMQGEDARDFPTEQKKVQYFYNRTAGNAKKHPAPRMEEDSDIPILSVDETFELLNDTYGEDEPVETVKAAFNKLYMTKQQTFSEFIPGSFSFQERERSQRASSVLS